MIEKPNHYSHNKSIIDFGQIQRQFVNLGVVISLQLHQEVSISWSHEVYGHTFTSETSRSTDTVDVLGSVIWHVVVDDQIDLLDIDTSAQQIGADQDP